MKRPITKQQTLVGGRVVGHGNNYRLLGVELTIKYENFYQNNRDVKLINMRKATLIENSIFEILFLNYSVYLYLNRK